MFLNFKLLKPRIFKSQSETYTLSWLYTYLSHCPWVSTHSFVIKACVFILLNSHQYLLTLMYPAINFQAIISQAIISQAASPFPRPSQSYLEIQNHFP